MSERLKVEKREIEGRAREDILYNQSEREKEIKRKGGKVKVRVRKKTESQREKTKKSKREIYVRYTEERAR